jgi:hypothetical protein
MAAGDLRSEECIAIEVQAGYRWPALPSPHRRHKSIRCTSNWSSPHLHGAIFHRSVLLLTVAIMMVWFSNSHRLRRLR